jgi:hypothetical protein
MDGFIERAQNTLRGFTAWSERASDKALTFIRQLLGDQAVWHLAHDILPAVATCSDDFGLTFS